MSSETITALVLGGGAFMLIVFFVFALRRARARRFDGLEDAPELTERRDRPSEAPVEAEPPADEPAVTEEAATEEAPVEPVESVAEPVEKPAPPVADDSKEAITRGLTKTRESFLGRINALFGGGKKVDAGVLDELEEVLLTADVGVSLTMELIDELRDELKAGKLDDAASVRGSLREKMMRVVSGQAAIADPLAIASEKPHVILFVGVNGVGKTTTIGKIASKLTDRGHSVVLAAGDTFRAAAAEQLGIWAERSGAKLIRGDEGTDPASVIFNAVQHAKDTGADYVLADTAGRLHTKSELMDEIKKVKRAAGKAREAAPDATWLVLDATTGQNGLQQANQFHSALDLSGVVLTKLDGTAKGGVVVAIAQALGLPVQFVGVGEQAKDLRAFDPEQFVQALFEG
ncbi:MAG: signal recognition particle-docking protein FtsY [Myxococcota bacterium]